MTKRALVAIAASALIPGVGHLILHRRPGRTLVGLTALFGAGLAAVGATAASSPARAATWLTNPNVLIGIATIFAFVGVVASAIQVDLARSVTLTRREGIVVRGIAVVTVAAIVAVVTTGAGAAITQRALIQSVFASGSGLKPIDGRYTILLLGLDEHQTRADSITVVSLAADGADAIIFAIPRQMYGLSVPSGSPLGELGALGSQCGRRCGLNFAYEDAKGRGELFPGTDRPEIAAVSGIAELVTGLTIQGVVAVDFNGFVKAVDAFGGIDVQVNRPVTLGTVTPLSGGSAEIFDVLDPGLHHMDGATTLWFARSRINSSNSERMERQACVVSALSATVSPARAAALYQSLLGVDAMVWSDIPIPSVAPLLELATRASIRTVVLEEPLVNPVDPDLDRLHIWVEGAIRGDDVVAEAQVRLDTIATGVAEPGVASEPAEPICGPA